MKIFWRPEPDADLAFAYAWRRRNLPIVRRLQRCAGIDPRTCWRRRALAATAVHRVFFGREIGPVEAGGEEVYTHVAQELDLPGLCNLLRAPHPWDVHGSRSAVLRGPFVSLRPGPWPAPICARDPMSGTNSSTHVRWQCLRYGLTAGFRSSCRYWLRPISEGRSRRPSLSLELVTE